MKAEKVAEIIQAYKAGGKIDELAKRLGIHRSTVTAHLDRSNVRRRRRGLTNAQNEEAARPYQNGWSLARLGKR